MSAGGSSERRGGALRWIARHRVFAIGLVVTLALVACAVLAPELAPYPPQRARYAERFLAPSLRHLMGTDEHGRDILSRVLYGGRVSLSVSAVAVAISGAIGIPLGLMIGYFGGVLDTVSGRIVDALFALPSILWAIAIVAVIGPSAEAATLALAIARVPITIRIARAATLAAKESEYVAASRILGSSWLFIVFRAILPNCTGALTVLLSLGLAVTILSEAGLSYLGLSVQPPTPSWGNLIQEGQGYLRDSIWVSLFPGMTLFVAVLSLNLVGDGLRDLLDARGRTRTG